MHYLTFNFPAPTTKLQNMTHYCISQCEHKIFSNPKQCLSLSIVHNCIIKDRCMSKFRTSAAYSHQSGRGGTATWCQPGPASHRARTISQLNIVTVKNLPPIIINNKEAVTIENFCHSFLPFDTAHILWQPVAGSGCQTCFIQSFYWQKMFGVQELLISSNLTVSLHAAWAR